MREFANLVYKVGRFFAEDGGDVSEAKRLDEFAFETREIW